ncbi:uncharacterized protein [Bactrocera oleae]|uniref:uncharacterized protein n=1 Tax=Bactrocera oleae TaxID=104688 RepID=UPI00387E7F35
MNNKDNNKTTTTTTKGSRQQQQQTTMDIDNDKGSGAGKGESGAKRKFSFLDALSPEERALFEEHARDDDDDMPSCSGVQQANSTAAAALKEKEKPTETLSSRSNCSDAEESQRATSGGAQKRKRKRGGRLPPLPPTGCPGGQDDPRRKGMSGASLKWYLRHLQEGRTPEVAESLARNRVRGDSTSPASEKHKGGNTAAIRKRNGNNRGHCPVNATQPAGRGCERAAPSTTQAAKRKSGQLTPQEPNNTKRQRGNNAQATSGHRSAPNLPRPVEGQRRYADALKGIRMAVLPLNYPAEALGAEELTSLQDLLMEEVFRGSGYKASFHGVYFKGGMLQVDCKDERSACWLREIAPKLTGWNGPILCAKKGDEIPPMHSMTVFLPRCAGKPYEFALGLIRNQNDGLDTSAWRVTKSIAEDSGWKLNLCIDDESYKFVRRVSFRLNYRFSSVVLRPFKPKTITEGDAGKDMQVDEVATQPCASTSKQAATAETMAKVPSEKTGEQGGALPSTQELLEGLTNLAGDIAEDGEHEDQLLMEPIL